LVDQVLTVGLEPGAWRAWSLESPCAPQRGVVLSESHPPRMPSMPEGPSLERLIMPSTLNLALRDDTICLTRREAEALLASCRRAGDADGVRRVLEALRGVGERVVLA